MSKAILIIDMPKNCYECKLQVHNMVGDRICVINHKNADNCASRGTWCPLKEMPGKYPKSQEWFSEEYVEGRNDCIDGILKGSNF